MASPHLDWAALMRLGLGHQGLHPDAFWALTPYEFSLMLGLDPTEKPLRFQGFADLMAAYPDSAQPVRKDP